MEAYELCNTYVIHVTLEYISQHDLWKPQDPSSAKRGQDQRRNGQHRNTSYGLRGESRPLKCPQSQRSSSTHFTGLSRGLGFRHFTGLSISLLALSHAFSLSLSLSLSHTHTHTHTLSLFVSFSLFLSLSRSLYCFFFVFVSLSLSLSHTLSLSLSLSLSLTLSLFLSLTLHCTYVLSTLESRGGGLGSRSKKMYRERLGDGVEYHLMSPTPRR